MQLNQENQCFFMKVRYVGSYSHYSQQECSLLHFHRLVLPKKKNHRCGVEQEYEETFKMTLLLTSAPVHIILCVIWTHKVSDAHQKRILYQ